MGRYKKIWIEASFKPKYDKRTNWQWTFRVINPDKPRERYCTDHKEKPHLQVMDEIEEHDEAWGIDVLNDIVDMGASVVSTETVCLGGLSGGTFVLVDTCRVEWPTEDNQEKLISVINYAIKKHGAKGALDAVTGELEDALCSIQYDRFPMPTKVTVERHNVRESFYVCYENEISVISF